MDQHLARARGDVDGEDVHRHVGGQTLRHAVFLGGGEAHRLAVRADRVIAAVRARHLRPRLQRHVLIGVGADQQRVVGVDRGDEALGDGGDLRRLAGGDVDGEDVVGRLGRVVLVRRTRAGIDHGLRGAGLEGRQVAGIEVLLLEGAHVDQADPVGAVHHHPLLVRRIGREVEIERL